MNRPVVVALALALALALVPFASCECTGDEPGEGEGERDAGAPDPNAVGLETRPTNATCVAADRPVFDSEIANDEPWPGLAVSFAEINDLMGLGTIREMERRFLTAQ